MNFLLSRAERLAEHLRGCIRRGELVEPLLGTRAWSEELHVSRVTLQSALGILQRDGLLRIHHGRTIRLIRKGGRPPVAKTRRLRLVRALYNRPETSIGLMSEWHASMAMRLTPMGVHLVLEQCVLRRLVAISRSAVPSHEMLLLYSLPAEYHQYFERLKRQTLVLGHVHPSSALSFITVDIEGAVRHAALSLLRKGFTRLCFVMPVGNSQGVLNAVSVFQKTCGEWRNPRVSFHVLRTPLETGALRMAVRRWAAGVGTGLGVVVATDMEAGMVVTALLERRIAIPGGAEVYALNTSIPSVRLAPRITCYAYPMQAEVRATAAAIHHYFESGFIPRVRKSLSMEAGIND